ncbi:MAG: hypothetical protein ACK5B9_13615 [Flavobacteriia bacterium]
MKKEITPSDLELIVSTLVPGAFHLEIISQFNKIQSNSGEFLADYNKPSSFVLVNFLEENVFSYAYDYIIDFSKKSNSHENYKVKEFVLKLNKDGSIQFLRELDKKDKIWKLNFFKSKERRFKVYFKESIFFQKQIQHLPCDNFWIHFGNSFQDRKINISLYEKNSQILEMKMAFNQEQIEVISKQKHLMSKLSFCDFNYLALPNEYFSKNPKLLIHSIIISEKNDNRLKQLFANYLTEINEKTGHTLTILNSNYWNELWQKINKVTNPELKELLINFSEKIDSMEQIDFCYSFGKIEHTCDDKLVCADLSSVNSEAPLFFDFFHQIINELAHLNIQNQLEIDKFLNKKGIEYNLINFLDTNNFPFTKYFNLFLLDYISTNYFEKNFNFVSILQSNSKPINIAS